MKKILFAILVTISFSGCSNMNGIYNGFVVPTYNGGKVVAEKAIEYDLIDSDTTSKLKLIDKGATSYHEVREVVQEGK